MRNESISLADVVRSARSAERSRCGRSMPLLPLHSALGVVTRLEGYSIHPILAPNTQHPVPNIGISNTSSATVNVPFFATCRVLLIEATHTPGRRRLVAKRVNAIRAYVVSSIACLAPSRQISSRCGHIDAMLVALQPGPASERSAMFSAS